MRHPAVDGGVAQSAGLYRQVGGPGQHPAPGAVIRGTRVVPRRRFERPTCRLGGGCSIRLSYRGYGKLLF